MLGAYYFRERWTAVVTVVVAIATVLANAAPSAPATVEDLKAKLSSASDGAKPHLCLQIAEMQLTETDKLYAGSEDEKARVTLSEVVMYSEMARDYAIQSHKYQKQTEIAVRGMTRKLTEVMHSLAHDDQAPVLDAVKRLQRVRDDLLTAMFPKAIR
jgi:hypothetical protein